MDSKTIFVIALVIAYVVYKFAFQKANAKSFHLGIYSAAGGAVCPRCQLPYSRHLLSPNLLVGKLE
ncbi:MAG: hypothetical protein N2D54_04870 [Chloroflexota bacterium]